MHVKDIHFIMAHFREDSGFFPEREIGRGKSGEDHPCGENCHAM